MRIEQRTLEDVTVLEISGVMTEEEHRTDILETTHRLMSAGRHEVVIDLEKVYFINSTGIGALVQVHTLVSKQGGRLWFSRPTHKIKDLFALTHLLSVFEFAKPEDLIGGRAAGRLVVACPICTPPIWLTLIPNDYQSCGSCRIQLMLSRTSIGNQDEGEIECTTVRIPTYDNEYVKLVVTDEQVIWVEGRLDLFAAEAVQDLWRLVPRPRRTIFAVPSARLTPAGLQPLLEICAVSNDSERSTIVLIGVLESLHVVPRHPSVHIDWRAARRALGTATDPPSGIRLRVRRA